MAFGRGEGVAESCQKEKASKKKKGKKSILAFISPQHDHRTLQTITIWGIKNQECSFGFSLAFL